MQSENRDLWLFHLAFRELVRVPDEILATYRLTRIHNRVLFVIARSGEIAVGDIADRLRITRQGIHAPMRQLRTKGLIDSRPSESNRSVQLIRLTESGAELERRAGEVQIQHLQRAFDASGPDGAQSWRQVMMHIAMNGNSTDE